MQVAARFGRAPMHAVHRRCVAFGRRDGAPEGARERTRAQHEPMARTVFPASRHVWRAYRGNAWRERVAGPGGASRPGMPGARCRRGMDCPANGIFFSRCARLMAGRRRQDTQWRRPRALAPPVLPNGGMRRGGSNVGERFTRASGRIRWVWSERARGRRLRGKGVLLPAPPRPHALHTTRRVAHHRTRRCGHRHALYVPADLHSPVEKAGDRIWTGRGSGLSSDAMAQRAGNEMACIGSAPPGQGGKCARRTPGGSRRRGGCGGAGGGGWAMRAGTTAQDVKMHMKTIGWCCFQVTRGAVGRSRSTRDNCRYRESGVNSSFARRNRATFAYYAPAIRSRAIPLCNLLIQWVFFASGGAPGAVGANRRRPGGRPCRFSITFPWEPAPCTASGARTPAHTGGERRTIRRRPPTRDAEGGRAARRRFAAPGGARRSG